MTAIASLPRDYARVPESGRAWSPSALRRRRAITHVQDRHGGLDVDPAGQLDELRRHLPRWPGRDQLIAIVDKIIDHPAVDEARGRKIGRDGLRAIWINDIIDAAQSGGLLRTTRRHAAMRAGYKDGEKTVQKARQIGKRVGLYIELYRGRELTQLERITLWHDHDHHKQRGFASVFALGVFAPSHATQLTTPQPGHLAQLRTPDSSHTEAATPLPRSGSLFNLPHLLQVLTSTAAHAAEQPKRKKGSTTRRKPRVGLGLAIELLTDPLLARVFAGVRPGRIAGQLKPYAQAGWHPSSLTAALHREASTLRVNPWEPARSPYGLLKTMLRGVGIIPDVDAALYGTVPHAQTPAPARPTPCGGAECDGYGWINTHTPDGYTSARPCPDCSPAVRGNHLAADDSHSTDLPF
ncbi:MAG: hypothetical protein ACTH8F_08305 [Microbacterium sp.]|uniref:hypothetical protein n=1 Tax=Microbacterium sp. TaxID=51671 RepID=UPI003F9CE46E